MKSFIKLFFLVLLYASAFANAADNTFDYIYPMKHDIARSAPQVFLFNKSGDLILKTDSFYPELKRALTLTAPVKNSEQQKQNLLNLLDIPSDFNSYDFTLFYLVFDSSVGPCPPCVKQEKIINQLQKKAKYRINVNKVIMKAA